MIVWAMTAIILLMAGKNKRVGSTEINLID